MTNEIEKLKKLLGEEPINKMPPELSGEMARQLKEAARISTIIVETVMLFAEDAKINPILVYSVASKLLDRNAKQLTKQMKSDLLRNNLGLTEEDINKETIRMEELIEDFIDTFTRTKPTPRR